MKYATERVRGHLSRFQQIARALGEGAPDGAPPALDAAQLAEWEARDNLFPDIDFRLYA